MLWLCGFIRKKKQKMAINLLNWQSLTCAAISFLEMFFRLFFPFGYQALNKCLRLYFFFAVDNISNVLN